MFSIAASDYPSLNITEGYAAMFAEASLSMYVNNDGTEELAFVLAMVRATLSHTLYLKMVYSPQLINL